jgi:hypothetical protein
MFVSFFSVPGELVRNRAGESINWSMRMPSSRTCTRIVCVPEVAK